MCLVTNRVSQWYCQTKFGYTFSRPDCLHPSMHQRLSNGSHQWTWALYGAQRSWCALKSSTQPPQVYSFVFFGVQTIVVHLWAWIMERSGTFCVWSLRWLDVCICTDASKKGFCVGVSWRMSRARIRSWVGLGTDEFQEKLLINSRQVSHAQDDCSGGCFRMLSFTRTESRADIWQMSLRLLEVSTWGLVTYVDVFREENIIIPKVCRHFPSGRTWYFRQSCADVDTLQRASRLFYIAFSHTSDIFVLSFDTISSELNYSAEGSLFFLRVCSRKDPFFMHLRNISHVFLTHKRTTEDVLLHHGCSWRIEVVSPCMLRISSRTPILLSPICRVQRVCFQIHTDYDARNTMMTIIQQLSHHNAPPIIWKMIASEAFENRCVLSLRLQWNELDSVLVHMNCQVSMERETQCLSNENDTEICHAHDVHHFVVQIADNTLGIQRRLQTSSLVPLIVILTGTQYRDDVCMSCTGESLRVLRSRAEESESERVVEPRLSSHCQTCVRPK